ncbi:GNAT family N-acetyltransferase [Salinibacillus aidingensis]|uniref:GNAT family N-acetyltransferase n=1 Tax=Salinibacillus aidingensis TaxID=237684 RepID=A0ABN1AM41_9BACI
MDIKFEPMTEDVYSDYIEKSIKQFAEESVRAGNLDKSQALEKAQDQFTKLLPDGLNTENHQLLSIFHDNNHIGMLWLHIKWTNLGKEAFIYDFFIDEQFRGNGMGKMSMSALDTYAQKLGLKKIGLHVFAHNQRAVYLYQKMGYEFTNHHMARYF